MGRNTGGLHENSTSIAGDADSGRSIRTAFRTRKIKRRCQAIRDNSRGFRLRSRKWRGEKKVVSPPYTYFLRAGDGGSGSPWTKLRTGSRLPVYTGNDSGMQYLDVGTNIDSRALSANDGRFDVTLNLERSWVEGDVLVPIERASAQTGEAHAGPFREPSFGRRKARSPRIR
jgi:hypothetical protein